MSAIEKEVIPNETLTPAKGILPVTDKVKVKLDKPKAPRVPKKDAVNDDIFHRLFEVQAEVKPVNEANPRATPREKEVKAVLADVGVLAQKSKDYESDFVARGNQVLYELLAGIYEVVCRIEQSDFRHEILHEIRKELKSRDIKVQTNTPDITVVVKSILGADRKRATNYARVLKIAQIERIPIAELKDYISRRGGIGQIHDTEASLEATKLGNQCSKERLRLLRELHWYQQWEEPFEITYEKPLLIHNPERKGGAESASFCFFLAVYDDTKNVHRIISAHDFGRTYEDCVLRFITKTATNDIERIRQGVETYKRNLLEQGKLPETVAKITRKCLEEGKLHPSLS